MITQLPPYPGSLLILCFARAEHFKKTHVNGVSAPRAFPIQNVGRRRGHRGRAWGMTAEQGRWSADEISVCASFSETLLFECLPPTRLVPPSASLLLVQHQNPGLVGKQVRAPHPSCRGFSPRRSQPAPPSSPKCGELLPSLAQSPPARRWGRWHPRPHPRRHHRRDPRFLPPSRPQR